MPISNWYEAGFSYTTHLHTIEGPGPNVKRFLADLRLEKEVTRMEVAKNTVFLVQRRKTDDVISAHYNPKIFSVKPVFVTAEGKEYCSFASWKKEILMDFLAGMQANKKMQITVLRFSSAKLDSIHYPAVMPKLSERQHEIFELAVQSGYYSYPRKIELQELAARMNLSPSTAQEHLRRAEEKLLPTSVSRTSPTSLKSRAAVRAKARASRRQ